MLTISSFERRLCLFVEMPHPESGAEKLQVVSETRNTLGTLQQEVKQRESSNSLEREYQEKKLDWLQRHREQVAQDLGKALEKRQRQGFIRKAFQMVNPGSDVNRLRAELRTVDGMIAKLQKNLGLPAKELGDQKEPLIRPLEPFEKERTPHLTTLQKLGHVLRNLTDKKGDIQFKIDLDNEILNDSGKYELGSREIRHIQKRIAANQQRLLNIAVQIHSVQNAIAQEMTVDDLYPERKPQPPVPQIEDIGPIG